MIVLEIESPGRPLRRVELEAPRITIGRSAQADLRLDDRFASRIHSELWFESDFYRVRDLGSANGTIHNQVTVGEPVQLHGGDTIRIGESTLKVAELAREPQRTKLMSFGDASLGSPERFREASHTAAVELEKVLERLAETRPVDRPSIGEGDLLSVVSKVGATLLSPDPLEEVLHEILGLIFDPITAERAFVVLLDADSGRPVMQAARDRMGQRLELPETVLNPEVQRAVVEEGRSVVETGAERSIMAVPLGNLEGIRGLIQVDARASAASFGRTDVELLKVFASVAAIKVEHSLLVEHRLENERLQQQLENAREIQARLFPHQPPRLEGYDVRGISLPCFAVGGDYFDFERWSETTLGVILGDVSGKGLDAALLISSVHAAARAQASPTMSLVQLVERVNRYLCQFTPVNKFATLFCAVLDSSVHRLHYVNAGHNPPIVVRADGSSEQLPPTGVPIGLMPDSDYASASIELTPGAVVVMFSDGLTEALNRQGEEFGEQRLTEVVRAHRSRSTARIRGQVDKALMRFVDQQPLADDMTIVLIKREE